MPSEYLSPANAGQAEFWRLRNKRKGGAGRGFSAAKVTPGAGAFFRSGYVSPGVAFALRAKRPVSGNDSTTAAAGDRYP